MIWSLFSPIGPTGLSFKLPWREEGGNVLGVRDVWHQPCAILLEGSPGSGCFPLNTKDNGITSWLLHTSSWLKPKLSATSLPPLSRFSGPTTTYPFHPSGMENGPGLSRWEVPHIWMERRLLTRNRCELTLREGADPQTLQFQSCHFGFAFKREGREGGRASVFMALIHSKHWKVSPTAENPQRKTEQGQSQDLAGSDCVRWEIETFFFFHPFLP